MFLCLYRADAKLGAVSEQFALKEGRRSCFLEGVVGCDHRSTPQPVSAGSRIYSAVILLPEGSLQQEYAGTRYSVLLSEEPRSGTEDSQQGCACVAEVILAMP